MNTYLKTALTFFGVYLVARAGMLGATIAARETFETNIPAPAAFIIILIISLGVTAYRFTDDHQSVPRIGAAVLHALTMTCGIIAVNMAMLILFNGGAGPVETQTDTTVLLSLGAIMAFIHPPIIWPAFPLFVHIALKFRARQAIKTTAERF